MHSTVTKYIIARLLVVSHLETIKKQALWNYYTNINSDPNYTTVLASDGIPIAGTTTKLKTEKQKSIFKAH